VWNVLRSLVTTSFSIIPVLFPLHNSVWPNFLNFSYLINTFPFSSCFGSHINPIWSTWNIVNTFLRNDVTYLPTRGNDADEVFNSVTLDILTVTDLLLWERVRRKYEKSANLLRKETYCLILIIVQRDATQSSLFIILQVHSTCSGCQPHSSSREHKTVTTTSGAGHAVLCSYLPPTWPSLATLEGDKLNSVALVRTRTIPTERPPPVGEVSANFCG